MSTRHSPHDFYGTSPRIPPSGGGGKLCDLYEPTTTAAGLFSAPPPYHHHPSAVTAGVPQSVNWVQQQSYGTGRSAARHRRPRGSEDKDNSGLGGDSNENDYESMDDEIPTDDGPMATGVKTLGSKVSQAAPYHVGSGGISGRTTATSVETSSGSCGYMTSTVVSSQQQQQQQGMNTSVVSNYAAPSLPLPTTGGAMMTSRPPYFATGYI